MKLRLFCGVFLLLLELAIPDSSIYYVSITDNLDNIGTLPFHTLTNLLDDSIILESDRKWIDIYENNGACLTTVCTKDLESCFNIKKSSEVTQDELVPANELAQRYLSDSSDSSDDTGSTEFVYMLLADICAPYQFCDINLNLNGVCKNVTTTYIEREALAVGQDCTEDMYWKMCAYGRMDCVDYKCAPISGDMLCQSSLDCWPDNYCSPNGECLSVKKVHEACIEQDECGRTAACFFPDLRKKEGECVEYFSMANGEQVATFTGHDYTFTNNTNMSISSFSTSLIQSITKP